MSDIRGMTQPAGRRENQHYVPKMLLRNFAIGASSSRGREQVHVLDKSTSRVFTANIRNIAAAFEFYEAELAGEPLDVEALLSELEGHTSAALEKVLAAETVADLSAEDRMWLSIFCSVQFVRTQTVRDRIGALNEDMEAHIRRMGYDPAQVAGFQRMSEDDIKKMGIGLIASALREYPKYFNQKAWFVMKAEGDLDFLIGDHPIVMSNDRRFGPYGNLGLAVPGVQIYLPLSPRLTLAMWCPSILVQIEDGWREPRQMLAQLRQLQDQQPALRAQATAQIAEVEMMIAYSDGIVSAVKNGGCIASNDGNTTMVNSLQVMNASRFVMSQSGNFALAERMFADNPAYRSRAGDGLRLGG